MGRTLRKIRCGKQVFRNGEGSLTIACAGSFFLPGLQVVPQTKQSLSRDGGRGAVHRLKVIVWLGRAVPVVSHAGQTWSTRVPVNQAIRGCLFDVVVRRSFRHFFEEREQCALPAVRFQFFVTQGFEKLQLLGIAAENPGMPACPGCERRIALLAACTAIRTIANVENGLMGHTAGNIVGVTSFSKVDIVTGCALSVPDEAMKQRDLAVLLAHEHMAKLMGHGKGA